MFRLVNSLKNKKGFTLIELIVVLAVLAIIMAIAVPRFLGVKEQAKIDADKSTLGLIAKTAEFYYVQGKISDTSDYVTKTDTKIAGDILTSLEKDFPGLRFQTDTTKKLEDVVLSVNSSTGKATTSLGSITN